MKFFVNNYNFFNSTNWERLNFNEHINYTQIKENATIIIDKINCITDLIELNKNYYQSTNLYIILYVLDLI